MDRRGKLWLTVGGITALCGCCRWLQVIDRSVRREMVMPIFPQPAPPKD